MYRTVDSGIWKDAWVSELSPYGKLLFIYLFTNDRITACGVLEITRRQMAFDTGLSLAEIDATLAEITAGGKVVWWPDLPLIWVRNFYARQRANSNDKFTGAARRALITFPACVQEWVGGVYPELGNGMGDPPPSHPHPTH